MPGVNRTVDEGTVYRSNARRLESVERRATEPGRSKEEEIIPWSHAGAVTLTASGDEPVWYVRRGGQFIEFSIHAVDASAATGNTVFTFYLNGVSLGTLTLTDTGAATDTDASGYLGDYRAKPGDKVTGRITTAGGHKGFSGFAVMKG